MLISSRTLTVMHDKHDKIVEVEFKFYLIKDIGTWLWKIHMKLVYDAKGCEKWFGKLWAAKQIR